MSDLGLRSRMTLACGAKKSPVLILMHLNICTNSYTKVLNNIKNLLLQHFVILKHKDANMIEDKNSISF